MRVFPQLACLSVCFILVVACDQPEALEQRDPAIERWPVSEMPVLTVGGLSDDGVPAFTTVQDATRLSDGDVLVADPFRATIAMFDGAGRWLRDIGRRGEGPGEFSVPVWMEQCGTDTVYVWDPGLLRLSVVDADGEIVRQVQATERLIPLSCSREGTIVGVSSPTPVRGSTPDIHALSGILRKWSRAGDEPNSIRTLGSIPLGEVRPLGRMTRIAVVGDDIVIGTADSAFVEYYLTEEDRRFVGLGLPPRRATRRHFEAATERMVSVMTSEEGRSRERLRLGQMPVPEFLPVYTDLFSTSDGTLWAVLSSPGDSVTSLRGLGPDGRILADLVLPTYVDVFEVGTDYVLGVSEVRATGEQYVVAYAFKHAVEATP